MVVMVMLIVVNSKVLRSRLHMPLARPVPWRWRGGVGCVGLQSVGSLPAPCRGMQGEQTMPLNRNNT